MSPFADDSEEVLELSWPDSVRTYDKMRNDEQIAAFLLAFTLPIKGYRWFINPNGARDAVVEHIANHFGQSSRAMTPPAEGSAPRPLQPRRLPAPRLAQVGIRLRVRRAGLPLWREGRAASHPQAGAPHARLGL